MSQPRRLTLARQRHVLRKINGSDGDSSRCVNESQEMQIRSA